MKRSRLKRASSNVRKTRIKKVYQPFMKVIRVGTVETNRGKWGSVYAKVEFDDNGNLSISGVIAPLPSGNALGGAGQIDMGFAHRNPEDDDLRTDNPIKPEEIRFAKGWDKEKWLDFLDVWKKYHLNDMKAGTPKQEEALRKWRAKHKIKEWVYDESVKYLKSIGLYNDGGYRYGTGWLREEVPESAIAFLKSLPDTDKKPAWV
jgi:hypothetical protein